MQWEKTYDKAIDVFNELLKLYPEDYMGRYYLGYLYMRLEELDKAQEHLELATKQKNPPFFVVQRLAIVYRFKGMYERSRMILEDYAKNFSDSAALRREIALAYIEEEGKLDPAYKQPGWLRGEE